VGERLSRKSREYTASVPWAAAVALAGSEETLKAGVPYSTWKGWENDDRVPAYVILPIVLQRYVPQHGTDSGQSSTHSAQKLPDSAPTDPAYAEWERNMADVAYQHIWRQVSLIYRLRQTDHLRWDLLQGMLANLTAGLDKTIDDNRKVETPGKSGTTGD